MALPEITFPTSYDTDTTLYSVKDSAYLKLIQDYSVGDTQVYVESNPEKMALFPPTGIITLTEQCSDPELRALSFYYAGRTDTSFFDLTILPGFTDSNKPANMTTVVMNVMAEHHENKKNAIIAIQNYIGTKGEVALRPLQEGANLEQRTNYLISVVFQPKAWFTADKTIGISPLTVQFTNQSLRMGDNLPENDIQFFWDFGDNTGSNISYITTTENVPASPLDVIVEDTDGGTITKTYTNPGIYTVTLRSVNKYGEDTIVFSDLINVKHTAPDQAYVEIIPSTNQGVINGTFKTPVNMQISLEIPDGINPDTGRTYSGEEVDGDDNPLDPIVTYTWSLADNLAHNNSTSTKALYSIGGMYDVVLRVDTETEAYRITTFDSFIVNGSDTTTGKINVIERSNLWLFTFVGTSETLVQASEMGLVSEEFKTKQVSTYNIDRNYEFLSSQYNADQLVKEFKKNTNFTIRAGNPSGVGGTAIISYASGRSLAALSTTEKIQSLEYNGFTESYSFFATFFRPWNWVGLSFQSVTYYLLGNIAYTPGNPKPAGLSLTNQDLLKHSLVTNVTTSSTFTSTDYLGLSTELQSNAAQFNNSGEEIYGYFSAYRTAWRGRQGYILKNDGVGTAFRLKSFYTTYEDGSDVISGFKKLGDILGPTKYEGILLNLRSDLYFFNNTGAVSAYNSETNVWKTGGPGYNSIAFRDLQDETVQNFDLETNTLIGTTDGADNAYLSYDYSADSFIKYNDVDLTFSKMPERPTGNQWVFGNY